MQGSAQVGVIPTNLAVSMKLKLMKILKIQVFITLSLIHSVLLLTSAENEHQGEIWSAKESAALANSLQSSALESYSDDDIDEQITDVNSDKAAKDDPNIISVKGMRCLSLYKYVLSDIKRSTEGLNKGPDETGVPSQEAEMIKAQHTKNQLQVWDDFMAIRMLQQPVSVVNNLYYSPLTFCQILTQAIRFPQLDNFKYFSKAEGSVGVVFKETAKDLEKVLDDIFPPISHP
jgi:hypothetical protein